MMSVVLLHSCIMPELCCTISIIDPTGAIENRFALVVRVQVFCDVKPFSSASIYRRFEGQVPSPSKVNVKQFVYRPRGFHEVEARIFRDSRHMNSVTLSAYTPAAFLSA